MGVTIGVTMLNRDTIVIIYLSILLSICQYLWMKDVREGAYQKGRAEILEIMAEQNYEAVPYTARSPRKVTK